MLINHHSISLKKDDYPISDSTRSFQEYIDHCQAYIKERRKDLSTDSQLADMIITANSPYELHPENPIRNGSRLKYGALLIHGLFDSPFTFRDIGSHLQTQGIYSRSVLLPGHGTHPSDLMHVSFYDWVHAVKQAVTSLRKEVEHIYLIGYSTGAALSIYHALEDNAISGIVLLAPAIKIKTPASVLLKWKSLMKWLTNRNTWLYREEEIDYAKYHSIAINAVTQVSLLTDIIHQKPIEEKLRCPIFMSVSLEDETISSRNAIDFWKRSAHERNQLLLYSSKKMDHTDERILLRPTHQLDARIKNLSHISLPFSPSNPHYGEEGDYTLASRRMVSDILYGAYNRFEVDTFNMLYKWKLIKEKRQELTYNPDFHYLAERITDFITT